MKNRVTHKKMEVVKMDYGLVPVYCKLVHPPIDRIKPLLHAHIEFPLSGYTLFIIFRRLADAEKAMTELEPRDWVELLDDYCVDFRLHINNGRTAFCLPLN
ncbi:MAG: hypothetical protein ACK4RF_07460 [Cyclobacteriaceae bacterium]